VLFSRHLLRQSFREGSHSSSVKRISDESTNCGQGDKRKNLPKWHSNHKANSSSQYQIPIDFIPKLFEYSKLELEKIIPDSFYVPMLTNQVAVDSFIVHDEYFYIFRFTIASEHAIKSGIVSLLSQYSESLPAETKWRFVFVIPSGSEVSCPQPRDSELQGLLNKMVLFSAELDTSK
jgi:hypothetical protein